MALFKIHVALVFLQEYDFVIFESGNVTLKRYVRWSAIERGRLCSARNLDTFTSAYCTCFSIGSFFLTNKSHKRDWFLFESKVFWWTEPSMCLTRSPLPWCSMFITFSHQAIYRMFSILRVVNLYHSLKLYFFKPSRQHFAWLMFLLCSRHVCFAM